MRNVKLKTLRLLSDDGSEKWFLDMVEELNGKVTRRWTANLVLVFVWFLYRFHFHKNPSTNPWSKQRKVLSLLAEPKVAYSPNTCRITNEAPSKQIPKTSVVNSLQSARAAPGPGVGILDSLLCRHLEKKIVTGQNRNHSSQNSKKKIEKKRKNLYDIIQLAGQHLIKLWFAHSIPRRN